MAYRDDREALRARVENLEQELAASRDGTDAFERALKPNPRRRKLAFAITGGVVVALAAAGGVGWFVSKRAAQREIDTTWSQLSACLVGEPLAAGESASSRARRIQLTYAARPDEKGVDGKWPTRCESIAHHMFQALREDGRAEEGVNDAAHWSEALAGKLRQGVGDVDLLPILDELWKQAEVAHLRASPRADGNAPAPAKPLHITDLAGASVTSVEVPMASVDVEGMTGPDRHVLVDAPQVDPAVLCTVTAKTDTVSCRPLPGELGHKHGLRLSGTTDAGAAPLVFAGHEGADGIYRSDTGELVAAVRAYGGYAAADGYVAVQSWPSTGDGHFDVIEQRRPGDKPTTTTIKPEAQKQPVTAIHRSRLLWDKVLLQLIDKRHLDVSPWVASETLGKDGLGGAFPRVADLNWINTTITGCRGARGTVARFGPHEAYLLFNDGDTWRGPLPAHNLGELRCDGADALFLSSAWPVEVKRCTPAGCKDESVHGGFWPTPPRRGMSAAEYVDGKVVAAWATERDGVRFRVASAPQLGNAPEIVVFDDLVTDKGEIGRASNVSGLRLIGAGHVAILFLATTLGVRAVQLGTDGSFAPVKLGAKAP